MNYKLILIGLLITSAQASDLIVGAHIGSWHSDPGYNNKNPGLYIRKDNIQIGSYKNSINKNTTYTGYVKDFDLFSGVSVGGMIGLGTGYSKTVVPMVVTSIKLGDNVRISYIPKVKARQLYTPHVLHLSLEHKF